MKMTRISRGRIAGLLGAAVVIGVSAVSAAVGQMAAEPGSREAPIVVVEPDRVVASPSRAYPDRALRMELEGAATIVCQVADDGRLTNCFVKSEAPKNYGFGQSSIDLSRHFRMNATTVEGVALHGKWISLTNRFILDCPRKAVDGVYTVGARTARGC